MAKSTAIAAPQSRYKLSIWSKIYSQIQYSLRPANYSAVSSLLLSPTKLSKQSTTKKMKSLQNKNTERLRGVAISDVCAKGAHILMNNFEGYHYDSVRPITLVHKLFRGRKIRAWGGPFKGTVEMDGKDWMPYQLANSVTPSFPEQVSSLSSFGGAAATILQAFTGSDQFKGCTAIEAGSSAIELGTTPAEDVMLDWPTFTAAAAEARNGRLIQWNPFYKRE